MLSVKEALERLQAGNLRYMRREQFITAYSSRRRLEEVASGQLPFAVILGCSDSRVPSEIVFDQGLGDLFVIRVAGNIVAPTQIGSVEFAVESFGTPLVVVLGHTHCGAITSTVNSVRWVQPEQSKHFYSIVDRIRPAVEALVLADSNMSEEELLRQSMRANVCESVRQLSDSSELLRDYEDRGLLSIVGADYDVETGAVEFFHNLPCP